MTHSLIDGLLAGRPVLTDGGWGTQFFKQRNRPDTRSELWNLSHPDLVEKVAKSYADAGSKIILTNTFQANRFALPDAVESIEAINHAGAQISKRAAGEHTKVFASMGPTNKLLVMGDVSEGELFDVFAEQATALADGGADGIVVETMSDLAEAMIALDAATATGLPVVVSMTFDTGKKGDRTMMGVTPADAAKTLADAGADVIGANCGLGVDRIAPVCEALVQATDLPIWIKANAGAPALIEREVVYEMTADEFAGHVERLVSAGADFIGGCCGTTPEFIAATDRMLRLDVDS
jgi:5-methyltetrahydrofolate--homocysteine methyltransferase